MYGDIRHLMTWVHNSWAPLFDMRYGEYSVSTEVCRIEGKIGSDFTPAPDKVFRFLNTDVEQIKVVVLGQDPYPQVGVATGRAFEPSGYDQWYAKTKNTSVRNILRAVYASVEGVKAYEDIPTYLEIGKLIRESKFRIAPPPEWFDSTEKQGVLWLNSALTCRVDEPGSHAEIWKGFMQSVIAYLLEQNSEIKWFLWGRNAINTFVESHRRTYAGRPVVVGGIQTEGALPESNMYVSRHPMMCSGTYEDDFLKNPCFRETSNLIDWRGLV